MGDGRPGLDAHAADAFNLPVIGVAKTPFRNATDAIEVGRGTATALNVTAAGGIGIDEAARIVAGIAGPHEQLSRPVDHRALNCLLGAGIRAGLASFWRLGVRLRSADGCRVFGAGCRAVS